MSATPHTSVPGLSIDEAQQASMILEGRLASMLDLQLTLKHVHWNVVGPNFLSVHEMLDEHVAVVRDFSDQLAERVRTLGGVPVGTPAAIVERRTWDDYGRSRGLVVDHLADLDGVYTGIIEDHRAAVSQLSELDAISEDLMIAQTAQLEMFQWFIRSFLETVAVDAGRVDPTARVTDAGVDMTSVDENYRRMTSVGAEVRGEGAI